MTDINSIIDQAKEYLGDIDKSIIIKAYEFAKKAHNGQNRQSGKPYISHPFATTEILLKMKPDIDTICAALLHDVPEDTKYTLADINKNFGKEVTKLVDGMIKLNKVHPITEEVQVDNLRKIFLAMAEDLRVVLIKFADRLHNLRTLKYVKPAKQQRIARESMDIYAALSTRLGIYYIKNEIEDICFKYLYPGEYQKTRQMIDAHLNHFKDNLNQAKTQIENLLITSNISARVETNIKNIYSIYKKICRKNANFFNELYDIASIKIILEEDKQNDLLSKCYTTLGIIHQRWPPLAHRFKDYIAVPKDNGYQSLHTAVIGLGDKKFMQPIEIHIKTEKMHTESIYGITWYYHNIKSDRAISQNKTSWVRNLIDLHQEWKNNHDFLETLKVDIFKDRIFVLTPSGDVKDLPQGATPIDFAYTLHSEIGNHFQSCSINGRPVPTNYKLQNGEIVEIITNTTPQPNLNWLEFTVTNIAKKNITYWFRKQNRRILIQVGKNLLNKQLARYNFNEISSEYKEIDQILSRKLSSIQRENYLVQIGKGLINASGVVKNLIEDEYRKSTIQNNRAQPQSFSYALKIIINQDLAVLQKTISILTHENIDLRVLNIRALNRSKFSIKIKIKQPYFETINRLIDRIEHLEGIHSIIREKSKPTT